MADTEASQANQQENQPSESEQSTSHLAATADSYQESTTLGDHDIEKQLMEGYGEFSSDPNLGTTNQQKQDQKPEDPRLAKYPSPPVKAHLWQQWNSWLTLHNSWIVTIPIALLLITLMGMAFYLFAPKNLRPTSTEQHSSPTEF